MLIDLHNHSTFSADACDAPEDIVTHAISCGYQCVGITDHNYYLDACFEQYRTELFRLKQTYRNRIIVACGMEVSYLKLDHFKPDLLSGFDYCLYEYFYPAQSLVEMVQYRKQFPCAFGLPHFDLLKAGEESGIDAIALLAENDIFWEMNVNYDHVHGWRTLPYVNAFFENKSAVRHARDCGLRFSVGYDTHCLADYDKNRVIETCRRLTENQLSIVNFSDH